MLSWLVDQLGHVSITISLDESSYLGFVGSNSYQPNCESCPSGPVKVKKLPVVHAVCLVPGKDYDYLGAGRIHVVEMLVNGIGGPPVRLPGRRV